MNAEKALTATDTEKLMTIADDLERLAETIRWRAVKGEWASQLSDANRDLTQLAIKLNRIICC